LCGADGTELDESMNLDYLARLEQKVAKRETEQVYRPCVVSNAVILKKLPRNDEGQRSVEPAVPSYLDVSLPIGQQNIRRQRDTFFD